MGLDNQLQLLPISNGVRIYLLKASHTLTVLEQPENLIEYPQRVILESSITGCYLLACKSHYLPLYDNLISRGELIQGNGFIPHSQQSIVIPVQVPWKHQIS